MAIGSWRVGIETKPENRIFYKIFGTLDFHTHIRLRPINKYIKGKKYNTVLEIGCGNGSVAFEIRQRSLFANYIGVDMNANAIKFANQVCEKLNYCNMNFINKDAFLYLEENRNKLNNVDVVILYDFLEHLPNPQEFLKKLDTLLEQNGNVNTEFLISVPTPVYPIVFGRKFHIAVGHVIDGFTKKEIGKMLETVNMNIDICKYNTGIIGNVGAYIFYNLCGEVRGKADIIVRNFITLPFRVFDINFRTFSSSMFIVGRKKR